MSNSAPLGNFGILSNGIGGPLDSLVSVGSAPGRTGAAASAPLTPEKVIELKKRAQRLEEQIAKYRASKNGGTTEKKKWVADFGLPELEKIRSQLESASSGGSDSFTAALTPTQALKGVQRGGATPAATPDASWNRQTSGVFEVAIQGLGRKPVSVAQLRDRLMKA